MKDALKNAGVDEANYTAKASASKQEDKEYDVDVAVIGGGAVIEWEGNADPTKNVSDTD